MKQGGMSMFSIGEFSHIARVTPRQLRHYEELGLFKPERIDPETYLLCGYVLPFLTLGLQQVLAKILPALARITHPNRWKDAPRACQHLQLYLPTRTTS
jgi:hypothetical protein